MITLRYYPESKEPKYVEQMGSNRHYTKGWLMALLIAEGAKRAGKGLLDRKRNLLRSQSVLVFVLAFLMSVPSYAGEVRGVTKDTIKIGLISDMTGPIVGIALPMAHGIRNYTRYVNDQGGINGRKIKLIIEDDRYSIPLAVAAFKKLLYRDKILALLGPISTGETNALMKHIMEQKLPTLTPAADRELIDPYKRYLFVSTDTYENQLGVLFDWMVQESKPKKPRIVCLVLDIGAKVPFLRGVKQWSKFFDLDVPIVMATLGSLDLTSEILLTKREKPDYVIALLTTDAMVVLLRDSKKLGLNTNVYASYSGTSQDVVDGAKNAADKFFGVHFYSSWYDDTPGMAELRKITLQYYPGTEKPYRPKNYSLGWVMATLLYEGIKRTGKDLDNEKLVDALETLRDFDTGGICGPVTYTSKSHAGIKYIKIYKGDSATGKLIPLSGWRSAPKIK